MQFTSCVLSRRRFAAAVLAPVVLPNTARAEAANWGFAPDTQGIDAARLEAILGDGARTAGLRTLVVARNGKLVGERHYAVAGAGAIQQVNSATKGVVSMLVGIALAQGRLRSLEATVGELLAEAVAKAPDAPANNVTLRQILTGTSGLTYDWSKSYFEMLRASDPVGYVLALPMGGGGWNYNDAAVSLLTPILQSAWRMPLAEIARRELFAPLAIGHFAWRQDARRSQLAYAGLQLGTRDLLKLAQLVVDEGRWQGTQVVPAAWIAESTRRHAGDAWPLPPIANSGYGYLWFTGTLHGHAVAWAWGYGGQFALAVPALRLSIATAATDPPPHQLQAQTHGIMRLAARVVEATA
ncbi:MAG: serine hydrolase [Burkholderiales bacterium]|nr:serine hydrolase [Burkholderiales bacterium]